jgi:hypothetical protein
MHPGTLGNNMMNKTLAIRQIYAFFCLAAVILIPARVFSQNNIEVGPMAGGSYYIGDLNPGKHFSNTQVMYGALIRYNIDTRWAVRLSVARGKIKGNSAQSTFLPDRNLQFESPVTDISAVAEFNFFSYFTGSRWNSITPYIYAGIGLFFFEPTSGGHRLKDLGTEGQNVGYNGRKPYSTLGLGFPLGLGVKYSLTKAIGFSAFWELHKTFTDYLDDVSTTYYLSGPVIDAGDPAQYLSDPTMNHTPDMQRGNPENHDWFVFFGLSATYKFNLHSSRKCKDTQYK